MNTHQSYEEIIRVVAEWLGNYAPKDLLQSAHNTKTLADYVLANHGIVSITNLTEAEAMLRAQLQYTPKPQPKTAEQLAEEQQQRWMKQHADTLNENAQESTVQKRIEKKNAADKHAKEQTASKAFIEGEIGRYECYRITRVGSAIDHVKSEQRRDYLRRLAKTNVNADQTALLALIRRKIMEFPD